jgi:hypothetical protein
LAPAGLPGPVDAPLASFARIANAARPTDELFVIMISPEPLGNRFRVVVICASNDEAHASTKAAAVTVFRLIPVLIFLKMTPFTAAENQPIVVAQ